MKDGTRRHSLGKHRQKEHEKKLVLLRNMESQLISFTQFTTVNC